MPRPLAKWKAEYLAKLGRIVNDELLDEMLTLAQRVGSDTVRNEDFWEYDQCLAELRERLADWLAEDEGEEFHAPA